MERFNSVTPCPVPVKWSVVQSDVERCNSCVVLDGCCFMTVFKVRNVMGVMAFTLDWPQLWSGCSFGFHEWPGHCTDDMSPGILAFASLDTTIHWDKSWQASTIKFTLAVLQCRLITNRLTPVLGGFRRENSPPCMMRFCFVQIYHPASHSGQAQHHQNKAV